MRKFLIVIEKSGNGFGAYSPDLPGCVAVGATQRETEKKMYEAISIHLEGMADEGLPVPKSRSIAEYMVLPEMA